MKAEQSKNYDNLTTEQLFEEYWKTHDNALKWEIALRYTDLIRTVALQLRGVFCSFAQLDDIISEGVMVLADVVDKYDPERGKFDTYVAKRIRGMIIDLARQQDWVPRSVRKRAKEIERAGAELYDQLGRFPTDREITTHLGLSDSEYQEAMTHASMHSIISLEELFECCEQWPGDNEEGGASPAAPETVLQNEELLSVLTDAIASLKKNEQMVLSLYYQKGLKMKDIASVLGVSAPRVSQIHAKALQKLKLLLSRYISEKA